MRYKTITLILTVLVYWIMVKYIPYGQLILYPLVLLVTFFHETGHALFALISGGAVHGIQINGNGSGYALLSGGIPLLMIPGGYIGSALWGNLYLYIALYKEKHRSKLLYFTMAIMLLSALWWHNSLFTSLLLISFAIGIFYLSKVKGKVQTILMLVIGTASLVYILLDFNGGPSSDLAKFSELLPFLPPFLWALVWLVIVGYITYLNLRKLWR